MPKYIEVDKFRRKIDNYIDQYGVLYIPITRLNIAMEKSSADAVEVVRCENCKYWVTSERELIAPYCEKIGIKDDNGYRDFDDFCSYGERKK